ncbi:hypothetical protein FRB90_006552 [Tulasnella sp. 427]|nr:hypothetical protein FRB90_006552 [Tulasnella sp. 427]
MTNIVTRFNIQPPRSSKSLVGLFYRIFFKQPHVAFKCLTAQNSVPRFFPSLRKLECVRGSPIHGVAGSILASRFIIREFWQFNSFLLLIPHILLQLNETPGPRLPHRLRIYPRAMVSGSATDERLRNFQR